MIYKKVKRIDEKISAIGIGCWNFGGDWDTSNDDNAIAIVHAAIDSGVNLFDVAPVYGWHHAERVLGKALKGGLREKVVIASKCGLVWNEKHETVNDLSRKAAAKFIGSRVGNHFRASDSNLFNRKPLYLRFNHPPYGFHFG